VTNHADDRLAALIALGFTELQAGFLFTVLRHAGVCLGRQYCTYTQQARGENMQQFFRTLVARRYATAYRCGATSTRAYHLHHRCLYGAIGEPESRLRKSVTVAGAVERLIVLDHVLAFRGVTWLGTAREKVAHFTLGTSLRPEELPHLVFGAAAARTRRHFPDRLPIGVMPDEERHIFPYVVGRASLWDFRAFLQRHTELLRALPRWTIRLLVPRHLTRAGSLYLRACREELASPLRPAVADELRWYFRESAAATSSDPERFRRAVRAFGAPRYRSLYRSWQRHGDRVIDGSTSTLLVDAVARGQGRIEEHLVSRRYLSVDSLLGAA
jgi:hypothetical protein